MMSETSSNIRGVSYLVLAMLILRYMERERQRRGFARIGFESTLILAVYGIVLVVMAT